MIRKNARRGLMSLVSSVAIAGVLAGTAGAKIPSVDADGPLTAARAIVVVPDAFERAATKRTQKLKAVAAGPDAFERAARRGAQGQLSGDEAMTRTPPQT